MKNILKQFAGIMAISILVLTLSDSGQIQAGQAGKILGKVKIAGAGASQGPELMVSAKGGIQNVVLTIEGARGRFRADPITIDQKDKTYVPRISVSMVGNELTYQNNDAMLHNVHSYEGVETLYNFAMPQFLKTKTVKLEEPGLMKVRCDVHQEMIAYVVVTDSPYYAITNEAGLFQIDRLRPGNYKIKAWHEKLGTLEKEITVTGGEKTAVIFEFPAAQN